MSSLPSSMEGNGLWMISRGFYPEPLEVILTFLFLSFLLGFLILASYSRTTRERSRKKKSDEYRYLLELKRYSFTPGEEKLLGEMVNHLPGGTRKADLLVRQEVFRYCEEKTVQVSTFPPMKLLASVRSKLGFTSYRSGHEIRSTSEIPPGSKLYFENQNSLAFSGIVVRIRPKDFIVRLTDGDNPAIGTPLDCVLNTREGRYAFNTFVGYAEYPHVYFEHSVISNHIQQRRYYRKELFTPVTVRMTGKNGKEWETTLIEISGGGCSVVNTGKVLSQGARLELFLDRTFSVTLLARVLRTSRSQSVAHLVFEIGREPDRDRLIRFIRQTS